ncbi:hypothetical protein KOW79_009992 [Hemibagrus wyckioides]|uniref:Secreted protein n=1 Tax=Hemibagrus wyckioides TaxID=337641 RepID=A0A9D3NN65_9TELE|nr:hypothetical protein KOW79_009992 [Hemibagrus wyckioides]
MHPWKKGNLFTLLLSCLQRSSLTQGSQGSAGAYPSRHRENMQTPHKKAPVCSNTGSQDLLAVRQQC